MKIIGWLREGDKTACGGIVIEGLPAHVRHGRPVSFQGARISCKRDCVIAEGLGHTSLPNGRAMCRHGHASSAGCPIYSTLNDFDGVSNRRGETFAERYFLNVDGAWAAVIEPAPNERPYDEQPQLTGSQAGGVPFRIETLDGRAFSGRADVDGRLPRIRTYGEDEYVVYWGDDALARADEDEA